MNIRFIISLLTIVFSFSIHTTPVFAAGNPYIASHGVNFASGNKYHKETDISIDGPVFPLTFTRHYNSQSTVNGDLGYGWSHSYSEKLAITSSKISHTRPDGRVVTYNYNSGEASWIKENGKYAKITKETSTEYHLFQNGYTTHIFHSDDDITGKVIQRLDRSGNYINFAYATDELAITDNFGRSLTLTYSGGKLDTLTIPDIGDFTYEYDGEGNLWKVTRPGATKFKEYLYETGTHNLTSIKDEELRTLLGTVYDTSDRVTNISLQDGSHPISIQYRPYPNNDQRIVTDNDEVTTYDLTYRFGIAQVESVSGSGCASCGLESGAEFTYTGRLQLEGVTDNDNVVTWYKYHDNGKRELIVEDNDNLDPDKKRSTAYTYYPTSQLLDTVTRESVVDETQNTTVTWSYDVNNYPQSKQEDGYTKEPPSTTPSSITRTTDFKYDDYGRIEKIYGSRDTVDNDNVFFEYYPDSGDEGNNQGMLKTIKRGVKETADGTELVTEFRDYNALRKPETIEDPNGVITELEYNDFGQLTYREAGTRITEYIYDDAGVLDKILLPENRLLDYVYYDSGKVWKIKDKPGNYIQFSYDYAGNMTAREIYDSGSALTAAIHHTYEPNHLLYKTWNDEGASETNPSEELEYDLVGNLEYRYALKETGVTVKTKYVYDAFRRRTDIIVDPDSSQVTTAFLYDKHDNRTQVTDPKQGLTKYAYDDFGRVYKRESPDSGDTLYEYDKADNLVKKTDANNKVLDYAYDGLNRLLTVKSGAQNLKTYTYDQTVESVSQKGFLTYMDDESGHSTYKYNIHGELTKEERVTNSKTFTVQYDYSDNGELKEITYPSQRVITYNRDEAGQLLSVFSEFDGDEGYIAQNIQSKPFGPITGMELGSGKDWSRSYDSLYRLTSSTVTDTYYRDYTYFANSQVDTITNHIPASPTTQEFTYDELGWLDTADALSTYGSLDFDHDDVGNRTGKNDNGTSTTYTYPAVNNKLDQILDTSTITYTHDGAGNITNIDVPDNDVYSWTDDNRLASVRKNSADVESYLYDGMGRRTVKDVAGGDVTLFVHGLGGEMLLEADDQGYIDREYVYLNGAPFVHFQYNPAVMAQSAALPTQDEETVSVSAPVIVEPAVAFEQNTPPVPVSPTSVATTSLTNSEIAASLVPVYLLLLFDDKSNQPVEGAYYYINDHLGTPQIITDDSGAVVWKGSYSPFGTATIDQSNTITNNIRFMGQYFDSGTGLHYNGFRYYSPVIGRYVSADPIGLSGGINLYAYVGGNPVNAVDPLGLYPGDEFDAIWDTFGVRNTNYQPGMVSAFFEVWVSNFHDDYKHCYIVCSGIKSGNPLSYQLAQIFELSQVSKDILVGDPVDDTPSFLFDRIPWAWERNWVEDMPYNRGGVECAESCKQSCDECCAKKFGRFSEQ